MWGRGRDLITGLPKTIVTSTEEIREAIEERRTTPNFSSEPVREADLKRMFMEGRFADFAALWLLALVVLVTDGYHALRVRAGRRRLGQPARARDFSFSVQLQKLDCIAIGFRCAISLRIGGE